MPWLGLGAFHCHGLGSVPGWRTEIPQAVLHGQKKKCIIVRIKYVIIGEILKSTQHIEDATQDWFLFLLFSLWLQGEHKTSIFSSRT